MYVGCSYKLLDFALWSRRSIIYMVVVRGLAMPWESLAKAANIEFRRRRYHIQEDKTSLGDEMRRLLGEDGEGMLKSPQPAIALLEMQLAEVNGLLKSTGVPTQVYSELMK